ncbi:MAG: SpaH/EbpB family LPXTG-anchored major pilin [Lactobacillus equicursoris]|uniref:SpaH/EbpB family LPXTG-anchored major pilin n=1 Tax=Lactobacillus equicursoris TaxID=420645 RepID=UPI00242B3D41|nr:SpaH/EbpB family LPXTG-anchored major pilin [Lactobacillus equicursoris]MDD6407096.1 SpaH/EbpB family LPXTG-anchored major pilin [Lactobacillus equicursoris]
MSKFGHKLSHLFSALVLLLSVFAALPGLAKADTAPGTDPKTITLKINDNASDFKYNGYRIMTAEFNGQYKDDFKYALNKKYETAVLDAANVKDFTSFKAFLKENEGSTNTGETSAMRKFAYKLSQNIQSAKLEPEKTFKSGDNTVNVDDKNAGYYLLVDATANSTANPHNYSATLLTGLVNKDVTLNVKPITPIVHKKVLEGDTDKDKKDRSYVDATDYAAGDTIPFMITGTIPSLIKSYDKYTYFFTDTLPKGLTLDEDSIAVQAEKVDSDYAKGINANKNATKPLTKGTDWKATVTENKDDGTTSLTVNLNNLKKLVEDHKISTDDTIVVTYNAKLNDNAVIGGAGNVNNVQLHYSNNPTGEGEGITNNKNAKVYTYELDVNKVTGQKALAGAGFTLYKKDANGEYKEVKVLNPDNAVTGSDSNVKNKYVFKELDQGEYKISETTVPKGYNKAADVTFKITAEFGKQNSADAALTKLSVANTNSSFNVNTDSGIVSTDVNNVSDKEFVLPSTGGMGRYIFLAAGALVVVAAVAFPSLKKKKLQ